MKRPKRSTLFLGVAVVAALLAIPGGSFFYESNAGESCARCHEIRPTFDLWRASTHRETNCKACHGGTLTLDMDFHLGNIRRLVKHWKDDAPEQIRIKSADVDRLMKQCRECHRQEFANWEAGPHSITYAEIFLNKDHNTKRRLMDDCLRCHGMYFEGGIRDLVEPTDLKGPWRLKDPSLANKPTIPCLACHSMHREGMPLKRARQKPDNPGPRQEIFRPSLALLDRRQMEHMPNARLPIPAMREGERPVKMSPDQRQALCYQCHSPLAGFQVGYGDDRTPIGVHEGISCLACHDKHRQTTRASCANCHPRLSNCGLDVEKMDTTFLSTKSKHNIHWVKCIDCHPKGVPPKKKPVQAD
jgi:Cytochrome c3/Cytochrome c554 and c-prime